MFGEKIRRFVFLIVAAVKIRRFRTELTGAGIDHFIRRGNVRELTLFYERSGVFRFFNNSRAARDRNSAQLGDRFIGEAVFFRFKIQKRRKLLLTGFYRCEFEFTERDVLQFCQKPYIDFRNFINFVDRHDAAHERFVDRKNSAVGTFADALFDALIAFVHKLF